MNRLRTAILINLQVALATFLFANDPLPGTARLDQNGDIASAMIDGIDRFLLKEIAESSKLRDRNWEAINVKDQTDLEVNNSEPLKPLRLQLAKMLGVVDTRIGDGRLELRSLSVR